MFLSFSHLLCCIRFLFFFFNDTAPTEIYTLSLHDALPILSLRGLIPGELAKGFGFFQSKPPSAFSPVCVTPDELGEAWQDSVIHLPLHVDYNREPFGRANAGVDATFSLAQLVAHAAKTRPLCAGTIIGSGTVSTQEPDGDAGKPVSAGGLG